MSDRNMECVFCKLETSQKVIKFTSDTIKKCKTVLEYRRNKPAHRKSRTTYKNIDISEETSINQGYHSHCYKLFTAIKVPADFQQSEQQNSVIRRETAREEFEESSETHVTDSFTTIQAAGSLTDEKEVSSNFEDFGNHLHFNEPAGVDGLPPVKCFICDKSRKRLRGREIPLAVDKSRTIKLLKSAATEFNDIGMLQKLISYSDDSNISYHKCCKDQYLREISRGDDSEFTKKRKASNTAYTMLCEMLEEYVVKNKEYLDFDHVKNEYQKLIVEQSKLLSDTISITLFSGRHLERKLKETFNHKIKIIYTDKKKILAPFTAHIPMFNDSFKSMAIKEAIRLVAHQLREEILNSCKTKYPKDCTAEDLITGDCDHVPELLKCFLETLIWGNISHLSKNSCEIIKNKNELSVFSLGQDLIYAASGHKIKTSKHIALGLAVKSLCNSKKIINILSKYGHCCSNSTLEELKTEMTVNNILVHAVTDETAQGNISESSTISVKGNRKRRASTEDPLSNITQ